MFAPGDHVVIVAGPMRGLHAVILHGMREESRVAILLTALNFSARAIVDIAQLEAVERPIPPKVAISVAEVGSDLMRHLAEHPQELHDLSSRRFEEVVCELMQDCGYDARLTPPTKDGGRDILAISKTPAGEMLTLVECKKYRRTHRVGVEIVQRFLWVLRDEDKASYGIVACTSDFTSGARKVADRYQWQLGLKAFDDIVGWLGQYGKWRVNDLGGLWVPKRDALEPQKTPNQALQTTSVTRSGFGKVSVSDRQRRGV